MYWIVRKREFFRIIDTSNIRNKGRVCSSLEVNKVQQVLKSVDKEKKYVRRSKCQYGAMAQYCKNTNKKIELCAEIGGHFEKKLGKEFKFYNPT